MPQFYFHLRAESTIRRDTVGTDCRDVHAAEALAREIAYDLLRNAENGRARLWSLRVEDGQGHAFDLYFADLVARFEAQSPDHRELAAESCRRVTALIDAMCAARDTMMQTRILLARARGKPQLVYDRGGGGASRRLGPRGLNSG